MAVKNVVQCTNKKGFIPFSIFPYAKGLNLGPRNFLFLSISGCLKENLENIYTFRQLEQKNCSQVNFNMCPEKTETLGGERLDVSSLERKYSSNW